MRPYSARAWNAAFGVHEPSGSTRTIPRAARSKSRSGGRQMPVRERVHERRIHPAGLVVAQQVHHVAGLPLLVALQPRCEFRGAAVFVVRHRLRPARDVGRAAECAGAELGRGVRLALRHRGRQGLRERRGVGRVAVPSVAGDDVERRPVHVLQRDRGVTDGPSEPLPHRGHRLGEEVAYRSAGGRDRLRHPHRVGEQRHALGQSRFRRPNEPEPAMHPERLHDHIHPGTSRRRLGIQPPRGVLAAGAQLRVFASPPPPGSTSCVTTSVRYRPRTEIR